MKTNEDHKRDFQNEKCLHVAIPLVKVAMSWLSIEEAGNKEKARELPFRAEAIGKSKLYITNADKAKTDYVKLYIVSRGGNMVRALYVKKDTLYPGERYHQVTET